MLLLGLEVPGREEMRVVSRGSDREVATARIDSENTPACCSDSSRITVT
jgi:hypothetical protein